TATDIAWCLVAECSEPILVDGEVHSAGASVGIASCPEHGADLATLVRQADLAMFDAKARHAGVMVYDPHQHHETRERLNVLRALTEHQLVLHYQPQADLRDGRIVGVEALVRWAHPERGLLFPDGFISFFEEAGVTTELTLEVLETAARQRAIWQRQGLDVGISINVPPSALSSALVDNVRRLLTGYDMPAQALTFEITESAMILDTERCRRILLELRALGASLSLDDYGTGYCSLSYLRDLPLDEVKIDRSFVQPCCRAPRTPPSSPPPSNSPTPWDCGPWPRAWRRPRRWRS
ncbi:MAG TPA: GGDEF domain-containing phosphodiesterase, partial [Kineosporiaceae bacterium]|nr:GGDEF domain-containing phosphodiesterase [Kineosporiaceae bacterium]